MLLYKIKEIDGGKTRSLRWTAEVSDALDAISSLSEPTDEHLRDATIVSASQVSEDMDADQMVSFLNAQYDCDLQEVLADNLGLVQQIRQTHRAWLGHRDTGHLSLYEAAELTISNLHNEIETLKKEKAELHKKLQLQDHATARGE